LRPTHPSKSITAIKQQIDAYRSMISDRLEEGWAGYLLTILFNPLRGPIGEINQQMRRHIEGIYASFLTRLIRRPKQAGWDRPQLIACPDWPVPKSAKKRLREIIANDGLHYHGILLTSPNQRLHRLRGTADQHFRERQAYYTQRAMLQSIEAAPFPLSDSDKVVDYALKGLKRNRLPEEEALLFLPDPNACRRPYISASNPR
jgi:hypothetical protein